MVVKVMKNELKLNNCGFDHDPVDSMMRSQWQSKTKNTFYLIYRWLIAVIFVATVIISLYSHLQRSSFGLFFIYLTHWGITLNMIVGIYGAVLVSIWHFHFNYQGISHTFRFWDDLIQHSIPCSNYPKKQWNPNLV